MIFNLGTDSLHKARVKIGSLSLNGFDGGGHSPCKSFKWPSSFILEEEERGERGRERGEELITLTDLGSGRPSLMSHSELEMM